MEKYTKEELDKALKVVDSTIKNCEKIHTKFEIGTSQHTLLRNRIKALYISKALIIDECITNKYTKEELENALPPVNSIISKCEKAQVKAIDESSTHTRLKKIIDAMCISREFIINEISKI